eukprot:354746-Chlamydomonas_euryale.AAC.5
MCGAHWWARLCCVWGGDKVWGTLVGAYVCVGGDKRTVGMWGCVPKGRDPRGCICGGAGLVCVGASRCRLVELCQSTQAPPPAGRAFSAGIGRPAGLRKNPFFPIAASHALTPPPSHSAPHILALGLGRLAQGCQSATRSSVWMCGRMCLATAQFDPSGLNAFAEDWLVWWWVKLPPVGWIGVIRTRLCAA